MTITEAVIAMGGEKMPHPTTETILELDELSEEQKDEYRGRRKNNRIGYRRLIKKNRGDRKYGI